MPPWLALGAPEYELVREQWIPRTTDEAFAFFLDPRNLIRITPPGMGFEILSVSTPEIRRGTLIDYRMRYFGIPYRWRTLIDEWVPGERFVDTQLLGPYILWHHTHTFKAAGGGVQLGDRVRYRLPFGPIGSLWHALSVRRELNGIFAHRQTKIAEILSDGIVQIGEPHRPQRGRGG